MRNSPLSLSAAALACLLGLSAAADAAFVISEAGGPFTPSFRGDAGTTLFAWERGTWDGNPPASPGDPDPSPDVVAGSPSFNPDGLSGPLLAQNSGGDIVSSSNNIYFGNPSLTLTIPTAAALDGSLLADNGYISIVIQGNSLGGFAATPLTVFGFGSIAGAAPQYAAAVNLEGETQWWAKWDIQTASLPASYTVDIFSRALVPGNPLSVTDMVVDTVFSPAGFAPDSAVAAPEAGSSALTLLAAAGMLSRRRRG